MNREDTSNRRFHNWGNAFRRVQDFRIQKGANSFINPFSLLKLGDTENVTNKVDHLYVDGISLVKLVNIFLRKSVSRYSFDDTSVAPVVFNFVKDNNLKIAIIGTTQENLEKSVVILENRYRINVTYYRNGFFSNAQQWTDAIQQIKEKQIDVVVCGMGTPLQEKFLIDLKEAGWEGYGYTCGGYLHQLATKEKYYPEFFNKLNIRWVYRIYDEPKLFHRYFVLYPVFAFHFFIYCLSRRA